MKFFYNIMKTWTGRDLTVDPVEPIHAADVFIANSSADPIPVVITLPVLDVLQTVFNENSANTIDDVTWLELADIVADISKLQLTFTAGQPLEFGVGPNSGSIVQKFIINQGEGPLTLDCVLSTGDKLWVSSLGSDVTTGFLTMNLIGTP